MEPDLDDTLAADLALDTTATVPGKRAQPATGELPAGMRLGHFKIERMLGAGGMGEVYLATDMALDRPVAIKVLPAAATSGAARERLIREARAQARVHHPHVGHMYFIGEQDGRLYFAMEYVTGMTLGERLAAGPLPVEDALAMTRAAALGLREAQRSGFTHRDVKPSNLMVDGHGVLKVLDFGLAAGAPEQASDGPVAQTTLAGTPLYMAPEQARGEPIDFRADIYALGATLFHLVSGRPPFQADSVEELVTLHASATRPALPRGDNPRTTIHAIDRLIARMMAPSPGHRFASYDDLIQAIDIASPGHTLPAGFWVRCIATGIDFTLVGILLALGIAGIAILVNGRDGDIGNIVALPGAAAYAVIAIGRWGTTIGKALFELEVVSITTSRRPTWGQAIRRELALAGLPLAIMAAAAATKVLGLKRHGDLYAIGTGIAVFLMIANLLIASLRVPGKRALWDRLSGTMVRYRTTRGRAGPLS